VVRNLREKRGSYLDRVAICDNVNSRWRFADQLSRSCWLELQKYALHCGPSLDREYAAGGYRDQIEFELHLLHAA
jgi:hypothetical protein